MSESIAVHRSVPVTVLGIHLLIVRVQTRHPFSENKPVLQPILSLIRFAGGLSRIQFWFDSGENTMNTKVSIRNTSLLTILILSGVGGLASAASDHATLTVGIVPGGVCNQSLAGFGSGAYGSYSPTGLTGGTTVTSLQDSIYLQFGCATNFSGVTISGFSSNPGSSWLMSVTCNSVTRSGASAGFSYLGGGVARWLWSNQFFGFHGLGNGANTGCTIVHN
jgi:hypothetical protein